MLKPLLAMLALGCSASAQTTSLTILNRFETLSQGFFPAFGAPVQDSAGNLYGTMAEGGSTACSGPGLNGCGLVYKYNASAGTVTTLHEFTGGSDGWNPQSGVILDSAGNVYGTARDGGPGGNSGTIFKIDTSGNFSVLYAFDGVSNAQNGYVLQAGLVMDRNGNLYGATQVGGNGGSGGTGGGDGVIFKLDSSLNYSVLYAFKGGTTDGEFPLNTLTLDSSGNLYGTTVAGGAHGYGVIFELSSQGVYSILYNFNGSDVEGVDSPLVIDSAGTLYGTGVAGGASQKGVIFKYSPTTGYSNILNFNGTDGQAPQGKLSLSNDGTKLFGSTFTGGNPACMPSGNTGCGLIFETSTTAPDLKVLYVFTGSANGAEPYTGLTIRALAGGSYELFGATLHGATANPTNGATGSTLFKLVVMP